MKAAFFFVLFLILPSRAGAGDQAGWSRYNVSLRRTEYFDDRGRLTGFSRYNPVFNRTEYFDRRSEPVGWSRPSALTDRVECHRGGLGRRVE